jgi:inosose dehydratase
MKLKPFSSSNTRRQFIKTLATAAWSAPLISTSQAWGQSTPDSGAPPKIFVGSNIYGWGQYYERDGKKVNDHLDEVLAALRECGYDYLEGFVDVNQPENNARFADRLRANNLVPVCLYTGGRFHPADKAQQTVDKLLETAAVCQKAGFTLIDCNPDPIGREKTNEELKCQANALNELGAGLKQLGMKLGIHNHTPEMVNHAREFHYTLDHTRAGTVGLCYDVHWVYRGGLPPADCLKQYGNRVVSWHLRQSRDGIWWEDLDTGDVDYPAVARFAKEHHLTAPYTVELALEKGTRITRSVVENHRQSREYVRRIFGA